MLDCIGIIWNIVDSMESPVYIHSRCIKKKGGGLSVALLWRKNSLLLLQNLWCILNIMQTKIVNAKKSTHIICSKKISLALYGYFTNWTLANKSEGCTFAPPPQLAKTRVRSCLQIKFRILKGFSAMFSTCRPFPGRSGNKVQIFAEKFGVFSMNHFWFIKQKLWRFFSYYLKTNSWKTYFFTWKLIQKFMKFPRWFCWGHPVYPRFLLIYWSFANMYAEIHCFSRLTRDVCKKTAELKDWNHNWIFLAFLTLLKCFIWDQRHSAEFLFLISSREKLSP